MTTLKNNQIKAVIIDLDGTTLNKNSKISKENKTAIKEALKKNIIVIIATGRGPSRVKKIYSKLNIDKYNYASVCFNGALTLDFNNSKIISSITMNKIQSKDIFLMAFKYDLKIWGYDESTNNVIYNSKKNWFIYLLFRSYHLKEIKFNSKKYNHRIFKFSFIGEKLNLSHFMKEVASKYSVTFFKHKIFKNFFLWEITNSKVDKSIAIEKLLNNLNLQWSNVFAIGDGHNDIKMIQKAQIGVTLKNAIDETKQQADYVTDYCKNNGLAKAINKFILNKNENYFKTS